MLTRDGYGRHRPILANCDGKNCHATFRANTPQLEDAKQLAHRHGWLMVVRDGVHIHLCPDCREDKPE